MPFARHFRLVFALGLVLAAAVPAGASAAESHVFKETFGSVVEPSFAIPSGLTIDESSGDLLVVDQGSNTLSRFNPDGTPADFSALGTNVIDGKVGPDKTPQDELSFIDARVVGVAVDNSGTASDGDIYVTQFSSHLIDIFSSTGAYLGQLTEFKEGASAEGALKAFADESACGVTVDSAGAVYVGDINGEVHKYVPTGNPAVNADSKANFSAALPCALATGVGPTAGFIFANEFNGGAGAGHILKLNATTGAQQYVVSTDANTTVSVDAGSGHVYGAAGSNVKDFDASGTTEASPLDSFSPGGQIGGIAIDGATGDVYVSRGGSSTIEVWETVSLPEAITEAVGAVGATTATLHGTVGAAGGPSTSCHFEYTTQASFEADKEVSGHDGFSGAATAPCEPPGPFTGNTLEEVEATISGLTSGTKYQFRVVATNNKVSNFGEELSFGTLGPVISDESASAITPDAAQISGKVNPNGRATNIAVEYVTQAAYEADKEVPGHDGFTGAALSPEAPRPIGAGSIPVAVTQGLSGLAEATTYHYRFVAINSDATSHGEDLSFRTRAEAPTLADERAYELVSPALKIGEVFAPEPKGILSGSCTECLPGSNDVTMPMQTTPDGNAVAYEGQPFAPGLAVGGNQYIGRRGSSSWASSFVTGQNFFATARADGTSGFKVFSEDLSKAVLSQGEPALTEDAPLGPGGKPFANLYLWEEGNLTPLVRTEPPNREAGSGGNTSFIAVYAGANSGAGGATPFTHIVFEANDALTGEVEGTAPPAPTVEPSFCRLSGEECNLYEWAGGELRLVNVLPNNTEASAGAVIGSGRQLASNAPLEAPDTDRAISADGSRIFWSSQAGQAYVRIDGVETIEIEDGGHYLTASVDGSKVLLDDGCLYSIAAEGCEALIGQAATFQGILGSSEDLSHVYFVDKAALTGGEENANEEAAAAGAFNLYAWVEGDTRFVGRLLGGDNVISGSMGDWKAAPQNRTAQVSPDGAYLAFMSRAPLSGYDNKVAGGKECGAGKPAACSETFEYAAGTGELTCVSCNPSNGRPLGQSNLSLISVFNTAPPFPQPHNLTDEGEGRIFFESQDALSPKDTNGHIQDVYEWEPNGVGSCQKAGGCVFLISSGNSPNDSMFVDSTPSGDDAFFVTRERLVPTDQDEMLDLYDARVNGGLEAIESAPCGGEGCKPPVSPPPVQPSSGSSGFSGPPNQKEAAKKKHKKAHHKKKKHHKKKHHKRAAKNKRGGAK